MQVDNELEQMRGSMKAKNEEIKRYVKEKYQYNYCTTSIQISLQGLAKGSEKWLGLFKESEMKSQHYFGLFNDMRFELEKFGSIAKLVIPTENDKRHPELKVGNIYACYDSIASAFACYNLLNGKEYDEFKVEIQFINGF
mmetsp:Transcript_6774/g.11382  ORF Transcript_6774/g.11382 Transcript_6774/m.11382 type:complete len:140 (+) Transcript_6774:1157-1576(+)